MKDVKKDLEDRLALLRDRYETAFATTVMLSAPAPFDTLASVLEGGLNERLDSAVTMAKAVIDPAELNSVAFWQTPLGALLFAAGGFPHKDMPQTLAARVLGCSRQYVSEMLKTGKLTAPHAASRMVLAEGVREQLCRKIDRLGK